MKELTGIPSIDKPWLKYYDEKSLNLEVPDMSITDYIIKLNKDRMFLTALNYLNKKISYEELFENIEKTSKRLQSYGVKENDYVSLAMSLTPETIYLMYGLDNIGANANLIDPRVPEEKMRFYLNLAKSRLAFVISSYAKTMINASLGSDVKNVIDVSPVASLDKKEIIKLMKSYSKRDIANIKFNVIKNEIEYNFNNALSKINNNSKIYTYDYFKNVKTGKLFIPEYKSGKTSVIEYTSGTTGIPKGLGLTSSGMNVTAEQLMNVTGVKPGESILCIMPPFISYGAVCGIHNSLASG